MLVAAVFIQYRETLRYQSVYFIALRRNGYSPISMLFRFHT